MALSTRQADGSWKWEWLVPNSNRPLPGETADGAEERAIAQLELDWAAAMVKGDMAALETGLAQEWTLTEDGQTTARAQALGAFKSGSLQGRVGDGARPERPRLRRRRHRDDDGGDEGDVHGQAGAARVAQHRLLREARRPLAGRDTQNTAVK